MLATLVIGLREGLEAALIVGLVAAFLRRNSASLKPMWLGVACAVLLSLAVGVGLELVSAALPQAQQEGMESVIGVVAVVIVTYMIVWMGKNARTIKDDLERHAGSALGGGSVLALAGMAFLAVLREGIETAVFLVAAFQSSVSPVAAGAGALIGLAMACAIGYGLYRGGVRLNLSRFFTATGAFLVLVAAGLIMKSLRSAHEAGWINAGQGATVDLSWLAPNGSARSAIFNGVFGIPSDPRVIEVLGWVLYLVPMLVFILWPRHLRPSAALRPRLQVAGAGVLAAAAATLAVAVPLSAPANVAGGPVALVSDGAAYGTAQISSSGGGNILAVTVAGRTTRYPLTDAGNETRAGLAARKFTATAAPLDASTRPGTISLAALRELNGGRMPLGVNAASNPGPFQASWSVRGGITVWLSHGRILDAVDTSASTLTITGGGLETSRTIVVGDDGWRVPDDGVSSAARAMAAQDSARNEAVLWGAWLPAVLALIAAALAMSGYRGRGAVGASYARTPETVPA